jgi:hypothetical protein
MQQPKTCPSFSACKSLSLVPGVTQEPDAIEEKNGDLRKEQSMCELLNDEWSDMVMFYNQTGRYDNDTNETEANEDPYDLNDLMDEVIVDEE